MKLNRGLEDLYGSAEHAVTDPSTLPLSNADRTQGDGARQISAEKFAGL
jgi:hypothetical protein